MSRHISFNGEIIPSTQACLNHNNRGIIYGDCFSLELRGNSSRPYLFDDYYDYIVSGIRFLSLEKSILLEKHVLLNDIYLLLQKNRIYKGFKARITFFRNSSNEKLANSNACSFIISTEVIANEFYQINEKGYSVLVHPDYKLSDFDFQNCIIPYFNKELLAKSFLRDNNIDDALITNTYGCITKSIYSSVFFVKGDKIIIPKQVLNDDSKVFFNFIITIAIKLNIHVVKYDIKEYKLDEIDEIFFANIIDGVKWVAGYKNKRYFNKISKRIAKELNNLLD